MNTKLRFVEDIIKKHYDIKRPQTNLFNNYEFTVNPNVFSPFIAPSGAINLQFSNLAIFENKKVLEVGCGSGTISCLFALNGAISVTGVDINEAAIENAKYNAKKLNLLSKTDFKVGNLFENLNLDSKFDIIYADLPFTHGFPSNLLEKAFYDMNLNSIHNLLWDFSRRSNFKETTLYLCLSNFDSDGIISLLSDPSLGLTHEIFMSLNLVEIELNIFKIQWS